MTTAKRRAIDQIRRERSSAQDRCHSSRPPVEGSGSPTFAASYEEIDDDLLRLMFVACHPVVSKEAHVALTLKLLGGLTTAEIARAFLTLGSDDRATHRPREAHALRSATFRSKYRPAPERRQAPRLDPRNRLSDLQRRLRRNGRRRRPAPRARRRCTAARAHARALSCRTKVKCYGLVALMEIQASRMQARVGPSGEPILLLDQDRSKWNRLLIHRGLTALAKAEAARAAHRPVWITSRDRRLPRPRRDCRTKPIGSASLRCTTRSRKSMPTPVVELNRAVAVGMAYGPQPDSTSSTHSSTSPHCEPTIYCRASAPICSSNSAASDEAERNSNAPPHSRETAATARSCSPARKLVIRSGGAKRRNRRTSVGVALSKAEARHAWKCV